MAGLIKSLNITDAILSGFTVLEKSHTNVYHSSRLPCVCVIMNADVGILYVHQNLVYRCLLCMHDIV